MASQFMTAPWSELEHLTPQETQSIHRYLQNPKSTAFLSVSEILRKQGFHHQSIVILEEGLKCFPHYHAARALLAKEYLSQSLFSESFDLIRIVVGQSPDNLLARRMELQLAVFFDERNLAAKSLEALKFLASDDPLTKAIRSSITMDDWFQARLIVQRHFVEMGLIIPEKIKQELFHENEFDSDSENETTDFQPWHIQKIKATPTLCRQKSHLFQSDLPKELDQTQLPDVFHYGDGLSHIRGEKERYLALSGFSRLKVDDALKKRKEGNKQKRIMEDKTLAQFYLEQGEELKALNLFSKLVREYPGDSYLIQVHQSLVQKVKEKRSQLPSPPPKDLKLKKLKFLLNQVTSKDN